MKSVCIFCGANTGNDLGLIQASQDLCHQLVDEGFHLIYGGGRAGLMREVADIFLAAGREVIGIRPEKLITDEPPHEEITKMMTVRDMFERKKLMMDLSDLFIALPGGAGTLDEIMEVFTHVKIGFVNKVCALYNYEGFYDDFERQLEKMVQFEFLTVSGKNQLVIASDPNELISISKDKMVDRPIIDKVALVLTDQGKVLVAKSRGKSRFYIPGGKREPGETDRETLSREAFEELSIAMNPSDIEYVGTFRAEAHGSCGHKDVKMSCYKGTYTGEIQASQEIEEVRWLNYQDKNLVSYVDLKIFDWLHQRQSIQ